MTVKRWQRALVASAVAVSTVAVSAAAVGAVTPSIEAQSVRITTVTPSRCHVSVGVVLGTSYCYLGDGWQRVEVICGSGAHKEGQWVRRRHISLVVCDTGIASIRTAKASRWL